jgi:hypothetical protein
LSIASFPQPCTPFLNKGYMQKSPDVLNFNSQCDSKKTVLFDKHFQDFVVNYNVKPTSLNMLSGLNLLSSGSKLSSYSVATTTNCQTNRTNHFYAYQWSPLPKTNPCPQSATTTTGLSTQSFQNCHPHPCNNLSKEKVHPSSDFFTSKGHQSYESSSQDQQCTTHLASSTQ